MSDVAIAIGRIRLAAHLAARFRLSRRDAERYVTWLVLMNMRYERRYSRGGGA